MPITHFNINIILTPVIHSLSGLTITPFTSTLSKGRAEPLSLSHYSTFYSHTQANFLSLLLISIILPVAPVSPHLAVDVGGHAFGVLQFLHQGGVPQETALRSGQPRQQLILQCLQLDLEVVLLHGEL